MHIYPTLCALSSLLFMSACFQDRQSDAHTHHASSDIPRTVSGVWPPLLEGVEDVQGLQVTALAAAKESVVEAMRASVLNNPTVKRSLGEDYREFEASLSDAKSDSAAVFLFYNYALNTSVEATFSNDGTVAVANTPASTFQPSEHPEEVVQSIALARAALVDNGFDLNNLIGTAMLAFPPISQLQNNEETFYDERILYVTFGPGDGELPEYSALVNLSAATVSDAKLIN